MAIGSISKRFVQVLLALEEGARVRSRSQFAEELNSHKQTISDIVNDKRNVTLDLVQKVCEVFFVNPNFIILGKLPMFIDPISTIKSNITFIPIKAQAGYGKMIDDPVYYNQLPIFHIPGVGFNEEDYRCFEIEGDSMYPTYENGDRVICSALPNVYFTQALKDRMVYVVVTEDTLVLKRILNNISLNKTITLLSDNTDYEDRIVDIKKIKEIWKVEGVITKRSFSKKG
jgi:transcriptional regulator with XRE-family HTH domain